MAERLPDELGALFVVGAIESNQVEANAALMLATVGLASAFGSKGIRINGINSGATLTGRVHEGLQAEAKMTGIAESELLSRNQKKIPLQC